MQERDSGTADCHTEVRPKITFDTHVKAIKCCNNESNAFVGGGEKTQLLQHD
jgi:hypothetical protein